MSQVTASGASQAALSNQVSMKIAEKTLDVAKTQGQAAISLLEDAAQLQQAVKPTPDAHRGHLLDTIG